MGWFHTSCSTIKMTAIFPGPDVWGCHGAVPSSGVSQPPVAATIIRQIWHADRAAGEERLRRLYPKLVAWHRWFINWRLDQGAACVTHPWEAGRDNAPEWDDSLAGIDPFDVGEYQRRDTLAVDPAMRPRKHDYDRYLWLINLGRNSGWDEARLLECNPFRFADPTMTFILLRANRDLSAMGEDLGEDTRELEEWTGQLVAGAESLWNPLIESYDARDVRSGKWSGCISNASFLCWYAGLRDNRMLRHLSRIRQSVQYWIPSHDPDSDKFDRRRYWRGPVWPFMNTLIGIGLEEAGLDDEAQSIRGGLPLHSSGTADLPNTSTPATVLPQAERTLPGPLPFGWPGSPREMERADGHNSTEIPGKVVRRRTSDQGCGP